MTTQGDATELTADDGMRLAATRFRPSAPAVGSLVVAGATAVPRGFYRRFAAYAADRGFDVVTLDYRGTGESRPASLRGFEMTFDDWAVHDIPAAIEAVASNRPTYLVGHSYGGSAFGLIPATDRLAGAYTFGSGAGWAGWMSKTERRKVWWMWHVGAIATAVLGYAPWSRMMRGEDLPAGAFSGWRRWCSFPHFVLDDPRVPNARERYAAVRIPLTYAVATDDPWGTPASRDAIVTGFTGARVRKVDIDPAPFGGLGHMGYFRDGSQPLWDEALSTLNGQR